VNEGTEGGTVVVTPQTQARLDRAGFLTNGLNRRIAVQRLGANRSPTNTLAVWATLRNRTDYEQHVLARIQFFGRDREPLEGPSAWQTVHLTGNGIETVRFQSTKVEVNHFYIEIKEMP
jgi:hypothetical protein